MKKWIISAISYLAIVVVGYNVYAFTIGTEAENHNSNIEDNQHSEKDTAHSEEEHDGTSDHHGSDAGHDSHGDNGSEHTSSEVDVKIDVKGDKLAINITDLTGNPVENLKLNHEKLLHLIIVDEHLEHYYHLHPEQIDKGVFEVTKQLSPGVYKAFVDIKPADLDYVVSPINLEIGETKASHSHESLIVDETFTKTVNNQTATLTTTELEAEKTVILTFDLPNATIEPYLGAMGHVVILDETGEDYIHVHPTNEKETIFEAQFPQAGIYKLWAEFKIDGNVLIYPFVIEVK
ncbi:hypothetical protein IMZ08_02400 [Bacillus luteolus]|uniref:Secreted protein n=1 Tax=Litchfieldia luteola TaxID=682179 RepID=A0ABR9QEH9_9BACI|nr:hypothetical protein [Cytobacillus luteolus]MBE4906909.1 hypothetical protein [Cytobacillus luteolus]MBP1943628.1 hypothetical protein [Cytobacillus luteolus]